MIMIKKILGVVGYVIISFVVISIGIIFIILFWAIFTPDEPARQPTEIQIMEHKKLLKKHGLYGIVIIEEKYDGNRWFYRDGKMCKLK